MNTFQLYIIFFISKPTFPGLIVGLPTLRLRNKVCRYFETVHTSHDYFEHVNSVALFCCLSSLDILA